ncbi:MAG: DUF4397 domain-containing protein [Sphingobacteriales bacterium]
MKNKILINLAGIAMILAVNSCKKTNVYLASGGSSLTIVNALVSGSALVGNFNYNVPLHYYRTAQQIANYNSLEFGNYSGDVQLALSQITDTTHTVFKGIVSLPKNTIQTLFITGTVAAPESFQTTDKPLYHAPADSTAGIRFVNLSPGSNPVSVDIIGNANGSEVTSLAYKNVTAFKNYAATYNIASYIFEFRDAASGALLGTYTLNGVNNGTGKNTSTNLVRWKNITIALKGSPGGTGTAAQGTFLINNY